MKRSKFFSQLAIGAVLTGALVGTAAAAPVAAFDFTQEFEWVDPIEPVSVVKEGTTDGISNVDGYTKLSWGTPSPNGTTGLPSSIVINPEAGDPTTPTGDLSSGTINVSEDINALIFEAGPSVVHNNFVIRGDALTDATAQDYVVLTPNPDDGLGDQTQEITFGISFKETVNTLTGANCPSGNENSFGCGDIFVLSGGLLGIPTIVNGGELAFLIDAFVRDGYLYSVFIREVGNALGVLSDAACAAAGASSGCIGFITPEEQSSIFQLEFAILATERNVPEPGTLSLLAGCLLMLGLFRRRQAKLGA